VEPLLESRIKSLSSYSPNFDLHFINNLSGKNESYEMRNTHNSSSATCSIRNNITNYDTYGRGNQSWKGRGEGRILAYGKEVPYHGSSLPSSV